MKSQWLIQSQLVRILPTYIRFPRLSHACGAVSPDRLMDGEIDNFRLNRRLRCPFSPAEPVREILLFAANSILQTNVDFLVRTKHCWQNYVDYYKCVNAKGEDFRPCKQVISTLTMFWKTYGLLLIPTQFYHSFRSLCPKAWTDRWDGQRGTYQTILDFAYVY